MTLNKLLNFPGTLFPLVVDGDNNTFLIVLLIIFNGICKASVSGSGI